MSTEKNNTALAERKADISAQVLAKIEDFQSTGELTIPKDYNPANALKSAYLILAETKNSSNQFALNHCSKVSVANALLKMVVWGLSPLKKQCSFIMYGEQLECVQEYTGTIAIAKRYGGLKDIKAHAVFEGDDFAFEIEAATGRKKITKHTQTLESMGSNKVKGAYAILEMNDGSFDAEIMAISQIEAAWAQGGAKGNSPAHKKFPDQMAKKTVINRACKLIIRGSDDSILYDDEEKTIDVTSADVDHEVKTKANRKEIKFNDKTEFEEIQEEVEDNENERLYEEALAEQDGKAEASNSPKF